MSHKYTGVCSKVFGGEYAHSVQLQGQARLLVQQCFNTINAAPINGKGLQYRTRTIGPFVIHAYVNTNGVVPIVKSWIESPEKPIQTINPEIPIQFLLSMESGLLYVPVDYQQGIIYPQVAQRSTGGHFLDRMITTSKFLSRDYSQSSMPSFSITPESSKWWGPPTSVAPFVIPGKLKLFVQSRIIGKEWNEKIEKENNYVDEVRQFLLEQLRYNDYHFAAQSKNRTLTLFTAAPGDYFFVWFDNGKVKARKLVSSNRLAGSKIKERMVSLSRASAEYQRLEAYLFTDVIFSGDWFELGNYDNIPGETIAYGWKPNWDGDKVSIVSHLRFEKPSAGIINPVRAVLATASIGVNSAYDKAEPVSEVNLPLTFSLSIIKDVRWIPDQKFKIFWPAYTLSGATSYRWYTIGSQEEYAYIPDSVAAPLYCFYTHNDALCVAEYERKEDEYNPNFDAKAIIDANNLVLAPTPIHIDESGTRTWEWGELSFKFYGSGLGHYVDKTSPFTSPSFGKISSQTERISVDYVVGGIVGESEPFCFGPHMTVQCNPIQTLWQDDRPNACTTNPDRYCEITSRTHSYTYNVASSTETSTTSVALVIPWGNSEAAYVVELDSTQFLGTVQTTESSSSIFSNAQASSGITNWRTLDARSPPNTPTITNIQNSTQIASRHYVDSFGSIELEQTTVSADGEPLVGVLDGLELLFYPPVGWDWFNGWFLSMTSVEGLRFSQEFPSQNNSPKNKITSNFGADWEFQAGVRQLFCGWQ